MALPKIHTSQFRIGDRSFVIFNDPDVNDEKFRIDEEVAGNWRPEIGETIRYFKMAMYYLDSANAHTRTDTLDSCRKVQIVGTYDTTGSKKIYFQFLFDPDGKFPEWKETWFWYKKGVKHYDVYFDTERWSISSTSNLEYSFKPDATVDSTRPKPGRGKI
jgi:hypothetical protein